MDKHGSQLHLSLLIKPLAAYRGGCRIGKRRLNNENLGLGLEINDDLRLNNRGLIKKSGSPEGL